MTDTPLDYNYQLAGFDGFMSRSIDDLSQVTLDSAGPQSAAIAFDRGQQSGAFGDTVQIGHIKLDGAAGRIVMDDGNNNVFLVGEDV